MYRRMFRLTVSKGAGGLGFLISEAKKVEIGAKRVEFDVATPCQRVQLLMGRFHAQNPAAKM